MRTLLFVGRHWNSAVIVVFVVAVMLRVTISKHRVFVSLSLSLCQGCCTSFFLVPFSFALFDELHQEKCNATTP